ncbi:hypothetical protein EAL2_c01280 [Peptoclostridium acidaminophilum DSM 3953]|uniref:Membrane-anchored protein n=1 Tax=Peptoclostridium acidaminophilum DSM 3953 TaxID=1286171 RepID=W8TGY5_PEPAC|nr:GDYXXLXY domain-containing protein [Peptoclostridium acidaminophilum]AHM55462.1 hypothetical protein EAL2_c01280 [Peptoclostridium acidaminophilum DSM 3953]
MDRMSKNKRYLLAAAVPIIILLCMLAVPLSVRFMGTDILVETEPYDPRDIFMGDYVYLSYKISQVDIDKFPEELIREKDVKKLEKFRGHPIYVLLKKDGKFHVVDKVLLEKPSEGIYLRSRLEDMYVFIYRAENLDRLGRIPQYTTKEELDYYTKVYLDYNMERYYVSENTGKKLEAMSRAGALVARVKVYKGYHLLEELFPEETMNGAAVQY